jgi:RNA polymerase sigma-70 factor (ECF subfamily)
MSERVSDVPSKVATPIAPPRNAAVDGAVLARLYARYSRSVRRRAASMLSDGDAAKDVTQEVFLRALGARAEFTAARSALTWLNRIATNLCLNRLRDSRRRRNILEQVTSFEESSTGPVGEVALTLETLLTKVPADLREIAVYYYVDQRSQEEIAAMLDLPRRTVGHRLGQFLDLARAASEARRSRA